MRLFVGLNASMFLKRNDHVFWGIIILILFLKEYLYIFTAGPTLLVDEGWKLIVRSVRVEDSRAQYSCSVLDTLTGERKRSSPISIDVSRWYHISIIS